MMEFTSACTDTGPLSSLTLIVPMSAEEKSGSINPFMCFQARVYHTANFLTLLKIPNGKAQFSEMGIEKL